MTYNGTYNVNGNKLRLYRLHKDRINVESYASNHEISRYERSVLARLRCGSLPLQVEVGRYTKIPLDQIICTLCQAGTIEDVVHFLVECKFYDDQRYEMFNVVSNDFTCFNELPALIRFILLMHTQSVSLLCKMVTNMFNRRKRHI